MRLSAIFAAAALVGCATQHPVVAECTRHLPPGQYTVIESFKLKTEGTSSQLEEGTEVAQPLSIKSYYTSWPEVSKWATTPNPSVALFSTGANRLVLCQVPNIKCSPTFTWVSLGQGSDARAGGRVEMRLEGICVTSLQQTSASPHNKSLERTRAQ
jgi:hypothetical protein